MLKSKHAYERELKTVHKKLKKSFVKLDKVLWHLSNQNFECEIDAKKALKEILKNEKEYNCRAPI